VAGLKSASFAQKLWRFCRDVRVEETALIEPMHQAVRQEVADQLGVLLAIHDWSTLSFGGHPSKTDRATLTHAHDVGYDRATVLMVRGDEGAPIAPAVVALTTADGVKSTRDDGPPADLCQIDQVRGAMQYVHDCGFAATVVHGIDREADSVNHWRQWTADGHRALVRGDDRKVLCGEQETTLVAVAQRLRSARTGPSTTPGRRGSMAGWRGGSSPRSRSCGIKRASGTRGRSRSRSPARRGRCDWSSPRSATSRAGSWRGGCS
jgi:hypothetical protein